MELSVHHLSKFYAEKKALRQVSFTLTEGIHGLLGPNGAGKTTLLHLISGILEASEGEVRWNNRNIHDLDRRYRRILGFQPQEPALYANFTPREFLLYMAAVKGMRMDKKRLNQQIEALLSELNLIQDADRRIREFSGGMKQRVNIAQALLSNPRLLLLDEPTSGLDPKERVQLKNHLSQISDNRIIIWSTHIVSDIEHISRDILILNKGELIDYGSAEELKMKLRGKVFQMEVPSQHLWEYEERYQIININRREDNCVIRLITDHPPQNAVLQTPTLEDFSLSCFNR